MVNKIWTSKNLSENGLVDMWEFVWLKYSNDMSINVILKQLWVSYYDEKIIRALLKTNNLMFINDRLFTNQRGTIKNGTLLKVPKNLLTTPSTHKEKDSKYRDDKKEVLKNTEKHQEANNLVSISEEQNRSQETTKKQLPKTFQIRTKEDIKILIELIKEVENQK